MTEPRRVQVTLDARSYATVSRIARREGRKLAAVVREAVEQYYVAPETRRRQLDAVERLVAMEPLPAPKSLSEWNREYSRLKVGEVADSLPLDDEDA
ncbi:MAG: ribbon-helix-helix protein, CopG family [Acidobacteria bacterium]|nr:ribbon-helix-helix protein, CopG family [Acidobacteriota bacterium]